MTKATDLAHSKPIKSLVQVKIGGRTYDAVQSSTCRTCMHPARLEIEAKIAQGHTYRAIAEMYSETEYTHGSGETITLPPIEWNHIFAHFQHGHLPVETAVLRAVVDERAKELGQAYEEQTSKLVDGYVFAKQVLTKAQEGLADGELSPTLSDGIAAAKLIQEIEKSSLGSVEVEAWSEAMMIYFETAQRFMPPEMWEHFVRSLEANPILQAISRRLVAQQQGDLEAIDAEIVKETP